MMGSMYQRISLETRTATAASSGYYLLYLLSLFVTNVCSWCCAFAALFCVHFCVRCFALTTSWSLGLCAVRVGVCALFCASYYRRTSHFEQSCEPTDFCKAETISGQRTTEPTRQRQKTESEGHNSRCGVGLSRR